MHPLNDAVDALPPDEPLLGELLLEELLLGELLPHAAASSASTLSAAAAGMERLTEILLFDGVRSAVTGCCPLRRDAGEPAPRSRTTRSAMSAG
jgi:hypothetical protein